jgi:hypothetical protein
MSNDRINELPIVARLTRERTHDFGRGLLGKTINPDGPEAAALIAEFAEAADHMLVAHESESGTHYSGAIEKLRAALSKARAQ